MDAQLEELLIGYALGILSLDEQQSVEIQIANNPLLRTKIQQLQRTVHQLALAAPRVQPKPIVKQQLLARARASKQTGPITRPATRRLSLAWAAGLALLIALGGWNIGLRSENNQLRTNVAGLEREVASERLRRVQADEQIAQAERAVAFVVAQTTTSRQLAGTEQSPKAVGTMYMQPGNQTAVLVVDGLAPLPEGQVYQFWLARAGQEPIPSDQFSVNAAGHAQLVITADSQVNDFQQVMVTIEVAGGSQTAPGTTVLAGNL